MAADAIEIVDLTFDGNEQDLALPADVRLMKMKGTGAGGWSLLHATGGHEFPYVQNESTGWMPVGRGAGGAVWIVKGTNTEQLFIHYIKGFGS